MMIPMKTDKQKSTYQRKMQLLSIKIVVNSDDLKLAKIISRSNKATGKYNNKWNVKFDKNSIKQIDLTLIEMWYPLKFHLPLKHIQQQMQETLL